MLEIILLVLSMALNIKLLSILSKRIDVGLLSAIEIIIGIVLLSLVSTTSGLNIFQRATLSDFLFFGLSGFFSFGIAWYLSIKHIKLSGEEKNAFLSPLVTVAVITTGIFILNEEITTRKLFGIALVIISVIYYELNAKSASSKLPKTKEIILLSLLVISIVAGIMFLRIQLKDSQLQTYQIIVLRYAGGFPVAIWLGTKALINRKKTSINFIGKDLILIIISTIISVFVINYLWIQCNQSNTNLVIQSSIAFLPLAVAAINFCFSKKIPSKIFWITLAICVLGILLVNI